MLGSFLRMMIFKRDCIVVFMKSGKVAVMSSEEDDGPIWLSDEVHLWLIKISIKKR